MGKKSLTKSTTKKKAVGSKKSAPKKKTESAAIKTEVATKKEAKPKAKATSKKAAAKKKLTAKKPTLKSLIKKDFGSWAPEFLFAVAPDEDYLNNFTAPPFIDETDKANAEKLKSILAKTFDLSVTEALEPPAAEAKTEAVEKTKAEAEAKAKTEKEAAEKATAEAEAKAKAEKEAAEKARAEAEAAKKAKAEKEAEEKAIAEAEAKAKAEKEAAEKVRADAAAKQEAEKPPAPPVIPKVAEPTEPPMGNALKMLIAIIGGLFGLLVIASAMNTNNYYLKSADNAVEIWQGKFSPTGMKLVINLPDATIAEPVKSVYTKKEALVPAFNYYINRAEALSEAKGLLDFESIKSNLNTAIKFAPTIQHEKEAETRLNKIDFMFLVYKADVAAGKKTIEGFEAALKNLTKAVALSSDKAQKELLDKKTAEISIALDSLKEKIKAEDAAAAPEKEAAEVNPQPEKNAGPEPAKHH